MGNQPWPQFQNGIRGRSIVYLYTYSSDNHLAVSKITILIAWAVRAELQYSGKIEIQKRSALFRNPKCFVDCSMERSIR